MTYAGKKRGTETSKVPTRVGLLVISLFCDLAVLNSDVPQDWSLLDQDIMKTFFKFNS